MTTTSCKETYKQQSGAPDDTVFKIKAVLILFVTWSLFQSSDGRVVRASASGAVHSGLIPSQVKPMTLKLVFTASLLDVQHQRDSVGNKLVSLFVVPLERALSGIPPRRCVRQVVGTLLSELGIAL